MAGSRRTSLHCACGHAVAAELRREGARVGTVAFFDDGPGGGAGGGRVRGCPRCGRTLGLHALAPRP